MSSPIALALATLLISGAAAADTAPPARVVVLTLKDHRFSPSQIAARPGERIRIELSNRDAASEEFDSDDLRVERDVTPHGKVSFEIGPLQPGRYSFMGELHPDTAQGEIVVAPGD